MNACPMALVLDFGGVVSKTLFETHDRTERALGLAPGSLAWQGPFAPETDGPWRDMQAGTISERDDWRLRTRETGRLIGRDWTRMEQFVRAARGADPLAVIRREALDAIAAVKKAGGKLAVLSNELDLFYGAEFRHKLPFLDDFDLIVDATHTHVLKPDPAAYRMVTEGLGLSAEACVFVDDQPRNIAGADAFGMKTVSFDVRDPGAGYREALTLLGLTP